MAFQNVEVIGIVSGIAPISAFITSSSSAYDSVPSGYTFADSIVWANYSSDAWIVGSSQWGMLKNGTWLEFWLNGTRIADTNIGGTWGNDCTVSLYFGLDEANQKGTIFTLIKYNVWGNWRYQFNYINLLLNTVNGYSWISGHLVPTYTWQSVPSISGKNGILVAMSTISDMNDGEPVTTTDTTKFTLVEESNVGVITEDIDDSIKPGADAGGISGSGDNSADQTTGNAFGQGESGTNVSGGGSGLYGGYKGTSAKSGGAGSGCIGNSLVYSKKMVGYNVPTSDVDSTRTESIDEVSASAVSGKPKSGNGFAKIKFLRNFDGHVYSNDEKVVGTWINGKDVYEKTFSGTWNICVGTESTGWITLDDISVSNCDELISVLGCDGYEESNTPKLWRINEGNLQSYNNHRYGTVTAHNITLRYTKNTN